MPINLKQNTFKYKDPTTGTYKSVDTIGETITFDAEAFAKGTRNNVLITDINDPAYQKNAKYYADQAAAANTSATGLVGAAAGAVRFDTEQQLTAIQQEQARQNIGGASVEQVNDLKDDLSEITETVQGTKEVYTPLEFSLESKTATQNGLTIVQNTNGTVHISGTASALTLVYFTDSNSNRLSFDLTNGETYRLSGCPSGGSDNTYRLDLRTSSSAILCTDYGNGYVITISAGSNTYYPGVRIPSGATVDIVVSLELAIRSIVTGNVLSAIDMVARDGKVNKQQEISDAGKALIIDTDGILRPSEITEGLTNEAKNALLACFRHVSWLDYDEDYYTALAEALDVQPERRLTVTFEPGNYVVYANEALSTLTPYLTVKYYSSPTAAGEIVSPQDYTLSGSLVVGDNIISVVYSGLICTFSVSAIDLYNVFRWEYKADGTGNLLKHTVGMFDKVVNNGSRDIAVGILTSSSRNTNDRRSWYVRTGKFPSYNGNTYNQLPFYPIPVPKTAQKFTATVTPNTNTHRITVYLYKYTETPVYGEYRYERINNSTMVTGVNSQTFTPSENLFISILARPVSDGEYDAEPEFTIVFE